MMKCDCELTDTNDIAPNTRIVTLCKLHSDLIIEAVELEREACAKISQSFFDTPNLPRASFVGHGAGQAIADAIRNRKERAA